MTAMFLIMILMILDAPDRRGALRPIPIGLCFTLIHLISIPVTGTSVNPARSTGTVLFVVR